MQNTLPITDSTPICWQGIPGLERTPAGRLYISWFSGGAKEPQLENFVLLSYSDDGGKTFTEPRIMASPENGTRAFDCGIWIDPLGRLWYFFNRGDDVNAVHTTHARICENPDAETPVWSPEHQIGLDTPYCFRLNKPTVLSTGEWLLPITHAVEPIHAWFARAKQLQGVAISKDEGKTWKLHGAIHAPEWALEPMTIELKDGRIWMLIRAGGGFLWESFSEDRGETWSEGRATTIASPGARFFLRRLASGNLLLVNHYNFEKRSHLTAKISTDEGATWCEGLLLDERTSVAYPDGVQDADGLIWITYDRDRKRDGHISLATFREEDVLAGKDVSGSVLLKHPVSRIAETEDGPPTGADMGYGMTRTDKGDPGW